jgi:hypothetical protein
VASKRDSILAHCIARAVIHESGANAERLTKWAALRAATKATPKASRVATFIVLWAAGMRMTEADEFSITEYQRCWSESERQAYRLQREFRELWPEFETPNELARQLVKHIDAQKASKREIMSLPTQLQMVA